MTDTSITKLCATPYDMDKAFFYFNDYAEYQAKAKQSGAEEFEMQYIDGEDSALWFSQLVAPDQCNLESFFEDLAEFQRVDDRERVAIAHHIGRGHTWDRFQDLLAVYCVRHCTGADHAEEQSHGWDIPGNYRRYIAWDEVARDEMLNGEYCEFISPDGETWVIIDD